MDRRVDVCSHVCFYVSMYIQKLADGGNFEIYLFIYSKIYCKNMPFRGGDLPHQADTYT